ncbi:MAG: RNA methyltransferase [Rickettsiaceae bacterium]|nr:RNA methyltransferase [Rickettsiaceae bacterium]
MANNNIVIILSRPQLGENIGACARAMKNFGISELRIIEPRDGWPNSKAISASAGASDIIESAKIYENISDALADLEFIYATTSKKRAINKDYVLTKDLGSSFDKSLKTGILFGRENWGLSNEEVSYATKIITIDTDPEFASLNIAQSVLVICYELFNKCQRPDLANTQNLATKEEMGFFCEHLFSILETKNFFKIREKEEQMKLNIRNIFARIEKLSKNEVKTLRGILSSME